MRIVAVIVLLPFLIYKVPIDHRFKDLRNRISLIPDSIHVNSGGCGFFALYMHDHLNSMHVENEIVYVPGKVGLKHVFVKVNDFFIDANGLLTPLAMNAFAWGNIRPITRAKLSTELRKDHLNKTFNRRDTALIKQLLKLTHENEN